MTNKLFDREALAPFADELSAHRFLAQLLWPEGPRCPKCSSARVGRLDGNTTRIGTYKCYVCRRQFSVLNGTLLSGSHVPAHKWLQAIYLTVGEKKSVNSFQLHRILNVSFRTAAQMQRRLRTAAGTSTDGASRGADLPRDEVFPTAWASSRGSGKEPSASSELNPG